MARKKRTFSSYSRKSGTKTPDKIIIATEGVRTEPDYFRALSDRNSRIEVKILERFGDDIGKSSPASVLQQLHNFKAQHAPRKHDQLWMVVDVDKWENLPEVVQACADNGYYIAISNPCIELWLLLHVRSIDEYTLAQQRELLRNAKVANKKKRRLEQELSDLLLDGFKKKRPQSWRFIPFVKVAISRARRLDSNPEEAIPVGLGTKVYLLAERILHHKLTG